MGIYGIYEYQTCERRQQIGSIVFQTFNSVSHLQSSQIGTDILLLKVSKLTYFLVAGGRINLGNSACLLYIRPYSICNPDKLRK